MPVVGITASSQRQAQRYVESVERRGGHARVFLPGDAPDPREAVDGIQALMLTGGEDVAPARYGENPDPTANLKVSEARDAMEFPILEEALRRDLPILCICRGMQVLNVAMGGRLIQDLPHHRAEERNGRWESARHMVYATPGSKLTAIIGGAGFIRVNSRHHQGLREAQRAQGLLASAYSPDDGLVEGLEIPGPRWVIGVQWHPEREEENPPFMGRLFQALIERAETYETYGASHPFTEEVVG